MAPSPCSPPFITNSLRVIDAWCLPAGGLLLTVQDTNKLLGLPRGYWFESQMREHSRGLVDLSFALEKSFREWYYRDNWAEGLQFYLFQEDPARNQQLKAVAMRAIGGGRVGEKVGQGDVPVSPRPLHGEQPCASPAMAGHWRVEPRSKVTHIVIQHADSCSPHQEAGWGTAWEGPLTIPYVSFCAALRPRAPQQQQRQGEQCPLAASSM